MERPGTPDNPLRVAVIGSGPAGFYAVQALLAAKGLTVRIDMFERLPTPFGLVRHGVAPDHQKIKSVNAVYHRLALSPGFRFFGNVEFGRDILMAELPDLYHQVVFSTGAQTDRRLGIPGEDLAGSHPATEFVAWYNGHPDYVDYQFDLRPRSAVVIGVGNVAVDVARILCRTPEELARTDIADYALEALRGAGVREVHLIGRRGPAQAAFTNAEIKELGEMEAAETSTIPEEVALDPLSLAEVEASGERVLKQKIEILQSYAGRREPDKPRKLSIRFLLSPVEILGDDEGRVRAVRLVHNELYAGRDGSLKARATDRFETIETGLVFRSVGYKGVALPGVPFREDWGVVPNEAGRVLSAPEGQPQPGLYVAGWIKRGPSGVIGTNKADAKETVDKMLEDLAAGLVFDASHPDPEAVDRLLESRGVLPVRYPDWQAIDELEVSQGAASGRPRVKLTTREAIFEALRSKIAAS